VTVDFEERLRRLPYIFHDPLKLNNKVDPKKLRFGSKIDSKDDEIKEYLTVKEIISPDILLLSNGVKVRLLGVKERPDRRTEAVRYLSALTRPQKVFLKFDEHRYDDDGHLLCYFYLWNKTFVNAHLIKKGLVDVDETMAYRLRQRFLGLRASAIA
jgi:site-specific DNA-methyltransferase (adenine-specific)